jgi:hypothetical protein
MQSAAFVCRLAYAILQWISIYRLLWESPSPSIFHYVSRLPRLHEAYIKLSSKANVLYFYCSFVNKAPFFIQKFALLA